MGMEKIDDMGKEIKIDPEFERQKKYQEQINKRNVYEGLVSKFSELIAENPIVIYTQHDGFDPENNNISFNQVNSVETDEFGSGGIISINFSQDDYIAVDRSGARGNYYFDKNSSHYKITKESLSNIMRMIDELINRSGYSDQEKSMMSKYVYDNFKNKIVTSGNLEKMETK